MKIILTQDVPKVGKRGEIVTVKDGFGRNFILAKNLGVIATKDAVHSAQKNIEAQEFQEKSEKTEAVELAKELDGKKVTITAKSGENGKLFGAVTSKEIADAIRDQLKVEIDKKYVELKDGSIKSLGEHDVVLRVYADTTSNITVAVVSEVTE